MEKELNQGEKIEDIAKTTCSLADYEYIIGFMYGCAVSILAECWEYGEQLRLWHNFDVKIRNEGEKANKSCKILNPAIIR